MSIFNNLKKWIGMAALAGSLMLPSTSKANQDMIEIIHGFNGRGDEIKVSHYDGELEGYGGYDTDYSIPGPWSGEWAPKITTQVDGHELELDLRPTNSVSSFNTSLGLKNKNGTDINDTDKLLINIYEDTDFTGFDPKRHYTASYQVYSNFTQNGQAFSEKKNLRDLCTAVNEYFEWTGPQVNLPASKTNENGEINFGTYTQNCDWNQLVSSKTGNGTNSLEGAVIMDYNADTNVTLNADADHYVQKYILTRTGNLGDVVVTTNNVPGQTNRYDVAVNGIKGSNSVHAVYDIKKTVNGIPHTWLTQYGITNKTDSVETNDADYDGVNNLQEYIADTNPTNDASVLPSLGIAQANSMDLTINPTSAGRDYSIYSKTNLLDAGNWNYETNSAGNGGSLTFSMNDAASDKKFYQYRISKP